MTSEHQAGLEAALSHSGGTHTFADVAERIALGEAQIWEDGDALLVTEIVDKPRVRILHFWLATGELEQVKALSDRVIVWGKKQGCKRATLAGRKGWVKALAPEWKPELVLMGRKI